MGLQSFYYRFLGSRLLISLIFNAFEVFFLWKIVAEYHSVFLAGMLATIYLAVSVLASIPIGHLIDRMNSTIVSLLSSIISLAGTLFLLLGASLAVIYLSAGIMALGITMKGDSFSAIMKKHLPEDQFLKGNSISQAGSYVSTLSGTALGGMAIIYFSGYLPYILIILALVSLFSSRPVEEASTIEGRSSAGKEFASAVRFYRKILGFIAVAFILNGLFEALDVYSSGLFHLVLMASPIYYTAFIASISIGGIVGSGLATRLMGKADSPTIISIFVLFYAPIFLLLGLSKSPLADVALGLTVGLLLSVINIPLQTILMKAIPRSIYGKVMAFLRIFLSGSTPGMAAALSFVAIFLQVDTILIYIGIIMLPVAALSFTVIPKLFKLGSENADTGSLLQVE